MYIVKYGIFISSIKRVSSVSAIVIALIVAFSNMELPLVFLSKKPILSHDNVRPYLSHQNVEYLDSFKCENFNHPLYSTHFLSRAEEIFRRPTIQE